MKLMKKYLTIIGIFTVFLLLPLSVQIQTKTITNPINIGFTTKTKINKNLININLSIANAQSKPYQVDTGDGLLNCNTGNFPSVSCGMVNFVYMITVEAGNYLVGMSAILMDFFLEHSLQSSSYNGSPFIKQGWEILRDVTNIVFIFALLFIAFQMVLGDQKGSAKKYLIKIILITLTINFSLFFSYAIIDSSNIFAHVFYNKIDQEAVDFQSAKGVPGGIKKKSASLAIADKINPQKIFLTKGQTFTKGEFLLISVMSGVINGVMIYVFLSVSFLFLGRTIGLWIAAILSPLAFASLTFPKMDNIQYIGFNKWLPSLIKMSFMAPVFIFILYLAVQFMNIYTIGTNTGGITIQNLLNIIIPLAMIAVILFLAKKVANSMAGDFAGIISGMVGKIVGGTLAIGAMAATGGIAAGGALTGGLTEGAGALAKKFGGEKAKEWGEKTIQKGRRMRSTKVMDVSKLPGFNKITSKSGLGGASKFFNKNIAGKSMRSVERDLSLGIKKVREKTDDMRKGKNFKEEEAKFDEKKQKYNDEHEKRKKGGAATWQENLIKQKEESDLIRAKKKAKSERSKAELGHEGKLIEAKQKLEKENNKLSSNQQFKDLSSTIEKQSKKQMDLEKKLSKKEKELKDIPIGFDNKEKTNSLIKEIKNTKKEINTTTNKIKEDQLEQKNMQKNRDMAQNNLKELESNMKKVGEEAETKSRKDSAEKLIEENNSPENQKTARKIIGGKGLKSEEEKLIAELVKKVKEEKK